MALFEVQRLVAAWPSLRNIKRLRKLLEEDEVKVCLIPGHVIVGSLCQDASSGGYPIHIFDQVPSSILQSDTIADPVIGLSPLVDIIMFTDSVIGMMCSSGTVHVKEFNRLSCQWIDRESFHLNCSDGGHLCKGVINECGHIVYLVQHNDSNSDWNYSVYVNSFLSVNNSYQIYEHTLLLSHCPLMEFFVVSNGVWIFVNGVVPSPPDTMMFYRNNSKDVNGYSFRYTSNRKSTVQCEDRISTQDYRLMCRKIAWKSKKASDDSNSSREYMVSICVHPMSRDLLVLLNDGRIYQLRWDDDCGIQYVFVVKLNAFTERYPLPKPWFTALIPESTAPKSPYTTLQFFLCYTYIGVFLHGELRLYDSTTGEFVWECDDLDHTSTRMITSCFPSHITNPPFPVVLLNQSGIYFLRCKRIVDHANMYVDSLFPIATNADETTPGDFLEDGELYAAYVCDLWGLTVLAAHYTITLAYQMLKKKNATPSLQPRLLSQLERLFNQSPSLCVALMAQYPSCHSFLIQCLNDCQIEKDIPTTLESEAVPLLKRYLELSLEFEKLIATPVPPINSNLPVKSRVIEILEVSQQYTASTDPTADLRTELFVLSSSSPCEVLSGMKEFMNVKGTFSESLKTGSCSPDINWRNLFACELAEKASLTSQKASVQVSRLPVFETVCNLLYQLDPNDLIHFVAFAHMVRQIQLGETSFIRRTIKKEYFYQRAIEAIPQPDDKSTDNQIGAFSELCLLSDCANVELEALSVLLKSNMWEKVITVLKGIQPEVPTHLNSALFHRSMLRFSSGGVLHMFLSQLWELLPKTFSILDFIEVLKSLKHEEDTVLTTNKQLSVAEITPYILNLLAQENDHKQIKQ